MEELCMSIRTIVGLSLLASVAAADAGPSGAPKGSNVQTHAVASGPNTKEKLISTYDAVGNGNGAALPQFAFTTIATSHVSCPNATGCSIGIESMTQVQTGGADWAICLLIDGASVECQYQGVQSGPSSYVVGNARGWGTVATGAHTVVTQIYTESATATYSYFQTDTRIYKP
jgi:hypothetical protein